MEAEHNAQASRVAEREREGKKDWAKHTERKMKPKGGGEPVQLTERKTSIGMMQSRRARTGGRR